MNQDEHIMNHDDHTMKVKCCASLGIPIVVGVPDFLHALPAIVTAWRLYDIPREFAEYYPAVATLQSSGRPCSPEACRQSSTLTLLSARSMVEALPIFSPKHLDSWGVYTGGGCHREKSRVSWGLQIFPNLVSTLDEQTAVIPRQCSC